MSHMNSSRSMQPEEAGLQQKWASSLASHHNGCRSSRTVWQHSNLQTGNCCCMPETIADAAAEPVSSGRQWSHSAHDTHAMLNMGLYISIYVYLCTSASKCSTLAWKAALLRLTWLYSALYGRHCAGNVNPQMPGDSCMCCCATDKACTARC